MLDPKAATAARNALRQLNDICSSGLSTGTKRVLDALEPQGILTCPIPLYVCEKSKTLSLRNTEVRSYRENVGCLASHEYHVHVFHTLIEASAALNVMKTIPFFEHVDAEVLVNGEAVVLARKPNVSHVSGFPVFHVTDHRKFSPSQAVNRPHLSSQSNQARFDAALEWAGFRACENAEQRGLILCKLLEEMTLDSQTLRMCQRALEQIPGAIVYGRGLSLAMIEDALSDLGIDCSLPETTCMQHLLCDTAPNALLSGVSIEDAAEQAATIFLASGAF